MCPDVHTHSLACFLSISPSLLPTPSHTPIHLPTKICTHVHSIARLLTYALTARVASFTDSPAKLIQQFAHFLAHIRSARGDACQPMQSLLQMKVNSRTAGCTQRHIQTDLRDSTDKVWSISSFPLSTPPPSLQVPPLSAPPPPSSSSRLCQPCLPPPPPQTPACIRPWPLPPGSPLPLCTLQA